MGRVSRYQSRQAGNTATFSTVDTLTSGSGADTIVLTGTIANASIDLGAGNATLALGNGTNSATVSNTETITGGTGNDTITLGTAFTTGMAVDLAGGANKLSLGAFTNTGTVSNVNTLIGGTAADTATLSAATVNGSADLGTGSDTLQLANFTNRISVTNTATVMGGTGDDTIILNGSTSSMVVGGSGMNFVTGDAGADEFVFDQNLAGNVSTVTNFSAAKGGDRIALDTTESSILTTDTYDLGSAALVNNTNLKAVADAATRLTVAEATAGKGGFVYQQDTGELYYSNNGSFAGGGTLVGVVDSSNSIPWAYDATKFVQV